MLRKNMVSKLGGVAVHRFNPSIWEVDTGRSLRGQGQPDLCDEFQDSLSYTVRHWVFFWGGGVWHLKCWLPKTHPSSCPPDTPFSCSLGTED